MQHHRPKALAAVHIVTVCTRSTITIVSSTIMAPNLTAGKAQSAVTNVAPRTSPRLNCGQNLVAPVSESGVGPFLAEIIVALDNYADLHLGYTLNGTDDKTGLTLVAAGADACSPGFGVMFDMKISKNQRVKYI